ncbi:hypothetical protein BKH46_02270 [Helicobacter sp. 12S02634-8]|uniref:metal ABC transporter solute-binding protein, Zn/Mn family n=1 Tax=Helicobacter sp. 12S02634-8 TaxID=1476199 RepID=UPI000BD862A7|nr:zinc ABC transporter substrate-binding protein [Helicobacter sp. 12S02634-8]PAF48153.1 hypothetical protein BKH46_02270 [Helicobacter sp. 12S02634-8]
MLVLRWIVFVVVCAGLVHGAGKLNIIVSVPPQVYFVKKIAGDGVNVIAMVPDGRSPETYEPRPSQMGDFKDASIYFGVGMEFEKVWLERFMSINPQIDFVDLSDGLELLAYDHSHHDHSHHGRYDPHIWLSVKLSSIQARKIYDTLKRLDPSKEAFYKKNLEQFLEEIKQLDIAIKAIFAAPNVHKVFVVYHPAFGYLAREYGLEEIALENEGKSPKTKEMVALRNLIAQKHIQVIYIQPQFSKKRIASLVDDLGLKVEVLDPLKEDWRENILHICRTIATQGGLD